MIFLLGCGMQGGDTGTAPAPPAEEYPYEHLSTWEFFEGDPASLTPRAGILPYEVVARLWSDGADKDRLLVLPEGEGATLTEADDWSFPDGSVVIKTFAFPVDDRDPSGARRILETRLLVRREGLWDPQIYIWNEAQDEAVREVAGSRTDVARIDAEGNPYLQEYILPNTNQCESCHMRDDVMHLLGPETRQMNRDRSDGTAQIDWLTDHGFFATPPPAAAALPAFPDPWDTTADLDARARAYLHANCSPCHRDGGAGGNSGLHLTADETEAVRYGVCKTAAAAGPGTGGFQYDIVPGDPDHSILVFRMESTDPELKMPELPNLLPDIEGVALIRAWIASLPGACDEG